jgi:putative Mg2+ transporter-C (MgtC) family protein
VEVFISELKAGWPEADRCVRVLIRLTIATLLGAIIGYQREAVGKAAGLRTHMLVSGGAALFVVSCREADMSLEGLSRVIQGLATGIGFIGAGAILKLTEERQITGLTTSAGIWMTAAVGVTVGLGHWGSAAISVVITWVILAVVGRLEFWSKRDREVTSGTSPSC